MPKPGRQPSVSDREILRAIMMSRAPFVHPTELADEFDMSRQGVYERLVKLADKGYLSSKKTGGTRNFWITDEGRNFATSDN